MFNKIYTAEWYKIINPKGLLDKLISCFSVLLNPLSKVSTKIYPYNRRLIREGYSFIDFKASDIVYVADKAIADSSILAGATNVVHNDYKYRLNLANTTIEMFGCGYTEYIAVKNMDYIIQDNVYWFKEHPAKYCEAFVQGNNISYRTVIISSQFMRIPQSLKPLTDLGCTKSSTEQYNTIVNNGFNGSINSLYLAYQGISTSGNVQGVFEHVWKEQDRTFGITSDYTMVSTSSKNDKALINKGSTLKVDVTPSYFTVTLNNISYPVSFLTNSIEDYPGLTKQYPSLRTYKSIFLGADLYNILKNEGCNFTELTYIDNYTTDNVLVNCSMFKGDKLVYLGSLSVEESVVFTSETTDKSSTAFPIPSDKDFEIKIKYML